MSLIDLRCPRCSQPLEAAAGIRVFVCDACGTTSTPAPDDRLSRVSRSEEPGPGGLWIPPRHLIRPRGELPRSAPIVLLPLWLVPLRVEAAATGLPEKILVPATGRDAFGRLVDSARRLTRTRRDFQELPAPPGRPVPLPPPAEMGVEEAYAVAEIVALGHLEGWPPDEEVANWQAPFGSLRLVDWPCRQTPQQLIDLVFGLAVDPALVRGLPLTDARARFHEATRSLTV